MSQLPLDQVAGAVPSTHMGVWLNRQVEYGASKVSRLRDGKEEERLRTQWRVGDVT